MSAESPIPILLVDDLQENLMALEALLRREGLLLLKARSGPEALELLLQHEVALALLDVQMPGMDGFELAELMRGTERTRRVPIIFLTAGGADWQRRFRGYEAGAVDFINKPIEPDILRSKVAIFTELARQRQQLVEARNAAESASVAKTEFLANMSHEIRTPMNAVVGLTNLLSLSEPLTQKQRQLLDTLQISADSLLSLINDLLDISKIEAQTVELEHIPFRLDQVIGEVASIMAVRAAEKRLAFTQDSERVKGRTYLGDPARLRQIVLNLCSNAIKFTESGAVTITVSPIAASRAGHEQVAITVADTGIGIPPDKLETIFHKFVQADTSINRKYGGTGLGLAITKTLIETMGGHIRVESTLGEGSRFILSLPLDIVSSPATAPEAVEAAGIETETLPAEKRVLLVEDYEANVLVASTFLEAFGYAHDLAASGVEAVEMTARRRYHAVLMDVQMPGMNGLDATRHIRERESQTGGAPQSIIGMTAHALAGDRERCLAAGMNDYISKPFNPDELRRKLEALPTGESASLPPRLD